MFALFYKIIEIFRARSERQNKCPKNNQNDQKESSKNALPDKGMQNLINGSSHFERKLINFLFWLIKNDKENTVYNNMKQYETMNRRKLNMVVTLG